ncbi:MAG: hypothetical protein IH962_01880 [Chloroflexi bacterium]|nr:hypothetical protein [Chloroflexota bacterium]
MTTWEKRFAESPVKTILQDSLQLLADLNPPPVFPDESEDVSRSRTVIKDIESRITLADYRLISEQTLGLLEQRSESLKTFLTQFSDTREIARLTEAVNVLNDLIVAASQLPPSPWGDAQDIIQELIEPVGSEIAGLKERLRELANEFKVTVEGIQENLSLISARSTEALDSLERESNHILEELGTDVKKQTNELSQWIESSDQRFQTQTNRLDQTISNINDNFGSSEQSRSEAFQQSQIERRNEFNRENELDRQRFATELEAKSNEGQRVIDKLEGTGARAEQILGVTAAAGTADAYLRDADQQRKQADLWRLVAIGSMALIVVAGFVTLSFLDPPANVPVAQAIFYYVARTTIIGGIVALAAYAIKESGQHRGRERISKQLANELTTFRPFLAELGERELNDQIKAASPRYFPGLPPSDPGQNQTDPPG